IKRDTDPKWKQKLASAGGDKPAEGESQADKEDVANKSESRKEGEKGSGPTTNDRAPISLMGNTHSETWYRIKVPPTAIDSRYLERLATIPNFKYSPTSRLMTALVSYAAFPILLAAMFYFLVIRPLRSQGGPGNVLAFGRS